MSKNASEGKDWVQDVTMHLPKKDEVNMALLTMRQHTKHVLRKKTQEHPAKTLGIGSSGS